MNKTPIEWVKNPDGTQGYTWNPITGCLNGCEYCYARKLANGRLKQRYLANKNTAPVVGNVLLPNLGFVEMNPFYPRFWPEKVKEMDRYGKQKTYAINIRKPKGIFVCDMSDLFGIGIPEWWQKAIFLAIKTNPQYRFYLLTKQPQNLIKFSPFPDNCWVGVTATDHISFSNALHYLMMLEAKVKYISFEPLLSRIFLDADMIKVADWVIIGAQTKPYKPPKWAWVEEIINACDKANIPVFLKGNLGLPRLSCEGATPFYKRHPSGTMELRQEMPEGR